VKTCKRGHQHNDKRCMECERERQRLYYSENRARIINRNADYAAAKFGYTRRSASQPESEQ
jgi:hypothetical protein